MMIRSGPVAYSGLPPYATASEISSLDRRLVQSLRILQANMAHLLASSHENLLRIGQLRPLQKANARPAGIHDDGQECLRRTLGRPEAHHQRVGVVVDEDRQPRRGAYAACRRPPRPARDLGRELRDEFAELDLGWLLFHEFNRE